MDKGPVQESLGRLQQALKRRDRAAVNAAAAELLDLKAPLGPQWQAIATVLARNGEVELSLRAADALIESASRAADARYLKAVLLAQSRRLDEASNEVAQVPVDRPDPASNAFLRGTIALNSGDLGAAEKHLRDVIEIQPASGQAWQVLGEIVDLGAEAELIDRVLEQYESGPRHAAERAPLAYAVGRAKHQRGDYAGAFEAFCEGAKARRESAPGGPGRSAIADPPPWPRALIDRAAKLVTVDHSRVIFVTGLPRSGSTLVEQILVSHPDVRGGEELGLIRLLAQDIDGADAASFAAWLDRGGDPNDLVRLYLRLASERMGPAGKFVDKTLDPAGSMGLLMALFPSAPIFWMRRDPIDNGWSAFRTYFARGVDWSYDLAAIGHMLGQDERLFARWSAEWPDRITPVDYAALVDNPRDGIERIARAANLDLHEDQLAPHLTERVVTTASVRQVREPINRKGLGVAEPYKRWLGTMIDAYRSKNGPYPSGSK